MKKRKFLTVLMVAVMIAGVLVGCGKGNGESSGKTDGDIGGNTSEAAGEVMQESETADGTQGKVYYLNFKPEVSQTWEDIAKRYTEETGVEVKVKTAASGQYEQTLKSEIAKTEAPTLFQINGPTGYQGWKDYCMDLKDTELYAMLLDSDLAIADGDGVYGIPYLEEAYGIIYNGAIMEKYFALAGAKASSMDEINNFNKLKEVVEDMTERKGEIGIDGVFASTSFSPGEDWRWQTHLMNLPIHYEYLDKNVSDENEITFDYNQNYKNIFDLYINNSVVEPTLVGAKSVDDSMAEFALGKAAMVQNGNWAWNQIKDVEGNVVREEDIKFLPIYTGVEGEESQGLCIGTENYFCVNSQISEEDQQATLDFVKWVFASDEGKEIVTNELEFITPFNTFAEDEIPNSPLAKEVYRYMADESLTTVSWDFLTFPSQTFKDNLGASLMEYAVGSGDWDTLVERTIEDWKVEKAAIIE